MVIEATPPSSGTSLPQATPAPAAEYVRQLEELSGFLVAPEPEQPYADNSQPKGENLVVRLPDDVVPKNPSPVVAPRKFGKPAKRFRIGEEPDEMIDVYVNDFTSRESLYELIEKHRSRESGDKKELFFGERREYLVEALLSLINSDFEKDLLQNAKAAQYIASDPVPSRPDGFHLPFMLRCTPAAITIYKPVDDKWVPAKRKSIKIHTVNRTAPAAKDYSDLIFEHWGIRPNGDYSDGGRPAPLVVFKALSDPHYEPPPRNVENLA